MNLLDKLAFEMSVKEMKKLLPEFKQFCEVAAEQMKMYYDSLIKAGFTPEQSMQLLLYHGINVGRMIGNNGGNSEQTD